MLRRDDSAGSPGSAGRWCAPGDPFVGKVGSRLMLNIKLLAVEEGARKGASRRSTTMKTTWSMRTEISKMWSLPGLAPKSAAAPPSRFFMAGNQHRRRASASLRPRRAN